MQIKEKTEQSPLKVINYLFHQVIYFRSEDIQILVIPASPLFLRKESSRTFLQRQEGSWSKK